MRVFYELSLSLFFFFSYATLRLTYRFPKTLSSSYFTLDLTSKQLKVLTKLYGKIQSGDVPHLVGSEPSKSESVLSCQYLFALNIEAPVCKARFLVSEFIANQNLMVTS